MSARICIGMVAAYVTLVAGASGLIAGAASSKDYAERQKWENRIVFYGDEATGAFSIRILDRFATEPANFKYLELWKYDLDSKKWIKVDDRVQTAHIVLPQDKPANSPEDSQLLAEIPVTLEKIGLYYCKWQINDIDGGNMERIGPGHVGKVPDLGKIPDGMIAADVPVEKATAKS